MPPKIPCMCPKQLQNMGETERMFTPVLSMSESIHGG